MQALTHMEKWKMERLVREYLDGKRTCKESYDPHYALPLDAHLCALRGRILRENQEIHLVRVDNKGKDVMIKVLLLHRREVENGYIVTRTLKRFCFENTAEELKNPAKAVITAHGGWYDEYWTPSKEDIEQDRKPHAQFFKGLPWRADHSAFLCGND